MISNKGIATIPVFIGPFKRLKGIISYINQVTNKPDKVFFRIKIDFEKEFFKCFKTALNISNYICGQTHPFLDLLY